MQIPLGLVVSATVLDLAFAQEFPAWYPVYAGRFGRVSCTGTVWNPRDRTLESMEAYCRRYAYAECAWWKLPASVLTALSTDYEYPTTQPEVRTQKLFDSMVCRENCRCRDLQGLERSRLTDYRMSGKRLYDWDFDKRFPTRLTVDAVPPGPYIKVNHGFTYPIFNQVSRIGADTYAGNFTEIYVYGNEKNKPKCDDEIELPDGLLFDTIREIIPVRFRYTSNTKLCAHILYGGSTRGNMAGVCMNSNVVPSALEFVKPFQANFFNIETYIHPNLQARAALAGLELYCSTVCDCVDRQRPPDRSEKVKIGCANGQCGTIQGFLNVLGAALGKTPPPAPDGRGVQLVPMRSAAINPYADIDRTGCRANRCDSPLGCGYSLNCRCRATRARLSTGPNISPYFVSGCVDKGMDERNRIELRKRGLPEEEFLCPCNTTYVSRSCCESEDGLVWEHGSLKLGELLV